MYRLIAVELLSIAGPLCSTQYRDGTILVTLCLMVWDWRVLRAEPTSTCWPNLFFIYVSNSLSLFLPSRGWLCGVGVLGLIGCSRSLAALHCRLFLIIIISQLNIIINYYSLVTYSNKLPIINYE